ncbi:MAG: amino acid adenylation domain-containing protein [Lachnospiraceae bacterium]|nr:amino acid adenylation domain-containing protein [Lachnospiraceae bacterium]
MKNILDYLEKTEQQYPNATAVDDGSLRLTWKELADQSRRIGTTFAKKVKPGKPVVILAEKSSITLAAMFGVVYAGCFYVIVDPAQPLARIQEMFQVLEPELVVVNDKSREILKQTSDRKKIYLLKEEQNEAVDRDLLMEIRRKSQETDLLYGIFTSGSTGTPKGIVVSHRAVIDFIIHFTYIFQFESCDRIGNQAPFDFDVSVKDIYTSVFTGAALILIPKELFSTPPVLLDYLCEKEITTLIWAVSALSLVAALKGLNYKVPKEVKKILFSGEVMPVKQLRMWQEALPRAEFVNLYGPTEITCNCTYHPIRGMVSDGEKIPIGRPFPGRTVFLLDDKGKKITVSGTIGEICVAGESLSEGYYHNTEETKKRFLCYSVQKEKEERYYKTGDLGYYGDDGELYFSGRRDFQIKHMGHRIELEEIERALEQIHGLERSCCVMDTKRNKIIAFYLGEIPLNEIKKQLREIVPAYMIPHKIVKTELMPLNKNGKTDREYFRQKIRGNV